METDNLTLSQATEALRENLRTHGERFSDRTGLCVASADSEACALTHAAEAQLLALDQTLAALVLLADRRLDQEALSALVKEA